MSGVDYFTIEQHSFNRDLSDLENFEINIFVPDVAKINTVSVAFFCDEINYSSYFTTFIGDYQLRNGWNKIRLARNDFISYGSNANWNNIRSMRITVSTRSSNVYVNIDRIAYNVKGLPKLIFNFEDGYYSVKSNAFPILNEKGFKANVMPVKNITETGNIAFLDKYDLHELYAAGWDIGNHTESHPLSIEGYTTEAKESEFLNAQNWLIENGWTRGAYHVYYPSGFYDSEIKGIVEAIGAKTAMYTDYGIQAVPVEDIYNLRSISIGEEVSLEWVKSEIDRAIATGSTIILNAFKVEDNPVLGFELSTQYFRELVEYVYSKSSQNLIEVVTFSEWYNDYMGLDDEPTGAPTPIPTIEPTPEPAFIKSYVPVNGTSLQTSEGIIIEEFDVIDSSYSFRRAKAEVSAHKVSGSGSLKLTSQVPEGGFNFTMEKRYTYGLNLSTLKNVEFNLYVPNVSEITAISIGMYTDNVYYGSYFINYIGAYELYSGWNKIVRRSSDFISVGSADWGNIKSIVITVYVKEGFRPSIYFDKIAYNIEGKSKLLFTFDDAWHDVLTEAKPIMDAKGFKGTLWATWELATGGEPEYLNPDELDYMYNEGWDIGIHTKSHFDDITVLPAEVKREEYEFCLNWLLENGWTRGAYHVCYPQGSFDEELIEILQEIGIKTARTTLTGIQPVPVENIYKLKCIPVGKDLSLDWIKNEIDRAVETGSSIMFMLHQVEKDPVEVYAISTESFAEIVEYIDNYVKQGKLEVQTISEWYESYIN